MRECLSGFWIDEIRCDLRQRLQHEGMLEFRARNPQITRTFQNQIIEEDDVDIERATGKARHIAPAAMRVFQRVQPLIQRVDIPVGFDDGGSVYEVRPVETDRPGTYPIRQYDITKSIAQDLYGSGQMMFRLLVGAQTQIGFRHPRANARFSRRRP